MQRWLCVISAIFWYANSLYGLIKLKIRRMILELAVFRLFFFIRTRSYTQIYKKSWTLICSECTGKYPLVLLEVQLVNVLPGLPGSLTGLCTSWFTWKFDRPMYHLDYLEICPAYVPAGLPGSLTGLCTTWFTWKYARPMYQLVYLEVWPAYVPPGLPGSMPGLSTSWFTWKFDRPMYQLVYLEVWPAYVPAGLPGSMTGQCIWW